MDAFLTVAALLALIAVAASVIHRMNSQHAERIALHTYSRFLPGRRAPTDPADRLAHPVPPPAGKGGRRDHRDGGRGRFRARRHRDRTTHKQSR
ncbi:hypothetical protein [Streptomyces sp. NPDC102360]|uniref:hypothetical protein n=1 Tax=Streptomyces sp. NPDC102360 TaxID=3366160 RepID=UPI0037FA91A7